MPQMMTDIRNMLTSIQAIETALEVIDGAAAGVVTGIPEGATPVWGCSAVVTTTTAVTVITDPAAGLRLYLTQIVATNITAAEMVTILIADSNGTPNKIVYLNPGDNAANGQAPGTIIWTPANPVKMVNTAEGITAEGVQATTGDTYVFAQGFTIDES